MNTQKVKEVVIITYILAALAFLVYYFWYLRKRQKENELQAELNQELHEQQLDAVEEWRQLTALRMKNERTPKVVDLTPRKAPAKKKVADSPKTSKLAPETNV